MRLNSFTVKNKIIANGHGLLLATLTHLNQSWEMFFLKGRKTNGNEISPVTIDRHGLKIHIGGASILVLESESVARTSLSELFRDEGHRVHEAPDSTSAIVQINNDPGVKVIMSDVDMPSWRSVVTHARDTLPAAVILGMSAQDSERVVLEAQQLGVHGFLIIPLLFDDVCKTILRLMTGRPLRCSGEHEDHAYRRRRQFNMHTEAGSTLTCDTKDRKSVV